jgi:hypothetical protein
MHRLRNFRGRKDSSREQFQARVPRDVVDRLKGKIITITLPASGADPERPVPVTFGQQIKFSLATRDAETGAVRRAFVKAELARIYDAARRGPAPLSQWNVTALAGEAYDWMMKTYGHNPGTPEEWEAWKAITRAAAEGRIPGAPPIRIGGRPDDDKIMAALLFGGKNPTPIINAMPADHENTALQQRCGQLAYWTLRNHGLEVDSASHLALLQEVARACLQAAWQLKRMAGGDYRPDPLAERFPPYVSVAPASVTFTNVVDRWAETDQPRQGSIKNRRTALAAFAMHIGHDQIDRVTGDDVMSWRKAMMASDIAPGTIKTRLSDARAAFNFAKRHRLIPASPFTDLPIGIKAHRLAPRPRMQGYTVTEVAEILALASTQADPCRRWLPLLAATSGAGFRTSRKYGRIVSATSMEFGFLR